MKIDLDNIDAPISFIFESTNVNSPAVRFVIECSNGELVSFPCLITENKIKLNLSNLKDHLSFISENASCFIEVIDGNRFYKPWSDVLEFESKEDITVALESDISGSSNDINVTEVLDYEVDKKQFIDDSSCDRDVYDLIRGRIRERLKTI